MNKELVVGDIVDKDENFIMSPKIDFAFKLLFGDVRRQHLLISFLSATLRLPKKEFEGLIFLNNELHKEYDDDKKGILDVRAMLVDKRQIDIEIQILPTQYMPQRTLFYWAKMYNGQIQSGNSYHALKKSITINIVDFKCVEIPKVHTQYHIAEDSCGEKLTDLLEIHFLELAKLKSCNMEPNDPIKIWLEFLNAESRSVMELLSEKNEDIKMAYEELKVISKDKQSRMAYEAREAAIMDEATRIEEAENRGEIKGKIEGQVETAIYMLRDNFLIEDIVKYTGLSKEKISELLEREK